MIERKVFLEMCRENAIKPDSVIGEYNGVQYHPIALKIWCNNEGFFQNSAVLKCVRTGTITQCLLNSFNPIDKDF